MDQSYEDYKKGRSGAPNYNNGHPYNQNQNVGFTRPESGFHSQIGLANQGQFPPNMYQQPIGQQPIGQQPQSIGMNTIIMNPANLQTGVPLPIAYGKNPQRVNCPYCYQLIETTVKSNATTKTHLMALLCCLCCPCGCCFVPYCMDSCQAQAHSCPNCDAFLGVHSN